MIPIPPIPPHEAGAVLTVDLGALVHNWRTLRERANGAECAAVVKGDAYGIGLEPAVAALARAGCRTFCVAHLVEARRLRAVAPDAVVYVLNGLLPGAAPAFAEIRARPVLGSVEEIEDWAEHGRAVGARLPAALHVDTGMNRLGLAPDEALALAGDPRLAGVEPVLLMTHLVSAEVEDDPLNARQRAAFERVRRAFPGLPASFANSSGIFLPAQPRDDMVRAGYALYGGDPTPGRPHALTPVVRLEARIVQLRDVPPGATVGYNARWTAPGPRRLATLSVGYADGYPRAASGTDDKARAGTPAGVALVAGRRCPFVGNVSMDLVVLDVSEVPREAVRRGDPVVLVGDGLTLDEVGRRAGTIGYEILTGLGRRYARVYLGG